MAKIQIDANMDNVDLSFPVFPTGQYVLECQKEPEVGRSRAQKPTLKVLWVIVSPSEAVLNGEMKQIVGKTIREVISLDPNAPYTLKARLVAAKVPYSVSSGLTEFDPIDFIGKQVKATISVKEATDGSGRKFNSIDRTEAVG